MKGSLRLLHCAAVIAIAGTASNVAHAAIITNWNVNNVVTTDVPDADGNFFSTVYDTENAAPNAPATGSNTNGYIKFTPPEGGTPGLKLVNQAPPNPDSLAPAPSASTSNCIMAAGDASCNSEFQSGKRFKLDSTTLDPIDLVFDVGTGGAVSQSALDTYKLFQKYGNNTDNVLSGFTIGLGFGVGDDFVSSTAGDGLSFWDFGSNPAPKPNEFSALFSHGLFGAVDDDNDRPQGYFSAERSGFMLDLLSEDLFKSTDLFGGEFGYSALFGDWMPYSMAPDGYFYDHDGDPLTDAILMAHYDEATSQWIMNRTLNTDGTIEMAAQGNDGAKYTTIASVESALIAQASDLTLAACPSTPPITPIPCLAGVGEIEDLAKFNVSYFVDPMSFDAVNSTYYVNGTPTITMRITAQAATVPEPSTLALLAIGLGLLVRRRKLLGNK